MHSGATLKSGHYVAVSRYGDQWYLCNDSTVEPITEGKLGNILQGEQQGYWGPSYQTYLFFFERIQQKPSREGSSIEKSIVQQMFPASQARKKENEDDLLGID